MANIVVSTTGGGQPSCPAGNDLVTPGAAGVGGVDENNVRAQALDCINRVRSEINMHAWRFLKRHISSTAFVAGQATYTLPTAFKSPSYMRILDTQGRPYLDLEYIDDAMLVHAVPQQTLTGPPSAYAIRNSFNDGLITFY